MMSTLLLVVLGLCALLILWSFIINLRPPNLKLLLSTIESAEFEESRYMAPSDVWDTFYGLEFQAVLFSEEVKIFYYRAVDDQEKVTEGLEIFRDYYGLLEVFYVDGEVSWVKGGIVKFEILSDDRGSKESLESILRIVQAKSVKRALAS